MANSLLTYSVRWLESRRFYAVIFAAVLLLHSWRLASPSLWWDEAATKASYRAGWKSIDAITLKLDVVHKLYYQLEYLVSLVFGSSTFVMRMPGVIAAGLACVAVIELVRQLKLSLIAGYLAALFLALTPRLFWASGEARSYAMIAATGAVSLLLFVVASKYSEKQSKRYVGWIWWLAFTGFYVFSVYLYLYQLLMLWPFLAFLIASKATRRVWIWAASSYFCVVLLSINLVWTSAHQQAQIDWNRLNIGAAPGLLGSQAFLDQLHPLTIYLASLLLLLVWQIRASRANPKSPETKSTRVASIVGLVWVLGPSLSLMAVTLCGVHLYNSRYVTFTLGGWALIFAALVGRTSVSKLISLVAIGLLAATVAVPFGYMRKPTAYQSDWSIAAAKLERLARPGDAVIFGDAWMYPIRRVSVMAAAYPEAFQRLADLGRTPDLTQLFDERTSWQQGIKGLNKMRRIWLILDSRHDQQEIARAAALLSKAGISETQIVKSRFTWLVLFQR